MLLPSPAIRAALRLDTPAKRFVWASEQLIGAMIPSPAVAASPGLGIPIKPLTRGVLPTNPLIEAVNDMYAHTLLSDPTKFSAKFNLPFNVAQYHRGVPFLLCVGEITTDAYLPHVGAIVAGLPIPDGSSVTTFEQYLVEQLSLMIVQSTSPVDFNTTELRDREVKLFTSEYASKTLPTMYLSTQINRTGMIGTNRYGDITSIVTV